MARREAETHPDEPGLSALADVVARQARERREQLRKLLAGARVQAFLIDLARFVETRGWLVAQDFGQTERLARAITTLARAVSQQALEEDRQACSGTCDADRGAAPRAAQGAQKAALCSRVLLLLISGRTNRSFLKRLKKLQTVFGDLNDAATLKAMFAGTDVPGADAPSVQRAIGWMIGASQPRQIGLNAAEALWRDLERTRPRSGNDDVAIAASLNVSSTRLRITLGAMLLGPAKWPDAEIAASIRDAHRLIECRMLRDLCRVTLSARSTPPSECFTARIRDEVFASTPLSAIVADRDRRNLAHRAWRDRKILSVDAVAFAGQVADACDHRRPGTWARLVAGKDLESARLAAVRLNQALEEAVSRLSRELPAELVSPRKSFWAAPSALGQLGRRVGMATPAELPEALEKVQVEFEKIITAAGEAVFASIVRGLHSFIDETDPAIWETCLRLRLRRSVWAPRQCRSRSRHVVDGRRDPSERGFSISRMRMICLRPWRVWLRLSPIGSRRRRFQRSLSHVARSLGDVAARHAGKGFFRRSAAIDDDCVLRVGQKSPACVCKALEEARVISGDVTEFAKGHRDVERFGGQCDSDNSRSSCRR